MLSSNTHAGLSLISLYLFMAFKEVYLTLFHILCEDTVVAE